MQNRSNPIHPARRTRRTTVLPCALLLVPLATGCGASLPTGDPVKLTELTWNGKQLNLGNVAAVTEVYDDTLVLTDTGAVVMTTGVPLAMDLTVKTWSKSALLPAADLSGLWAVGLDGTGALRRLKNRSLMEDISDRYGLDGTAVSELAGAGAMGAVFSTATELAVADGQTVVRIPGALSQLAGTQGRAAGVYAGQLRTVDFQSQQARDYELHDPTGVLFDENSKLVVATQDSLYRENADGALDKIYTSAAEPIHGMTRSGTTVWLHLGGTLAMLQDGKLRRPAPDDPYATLPDDAQLFPSPSGNVWTLSSGKLRLLGEDNGSGADQDLWRLQVQPIFTRLCATCHLPGGSSGNEVSTYPAWVARRDRVLQRVINGLPTPMPPAGAGTLTADERTGLQAWLDNTPPM